MTYLFKMSTLTLTALIAAALPVHAVEIGRNSAVKGTVTVTGSDLIESQAIVKEPIFLGDEIKSKSQSSLQILLKDETVFTVGPECKLTIDKFVYNPQTNSNAIKAKVTRGMFRYMSGNAAKTNPDDITIETPTATMGIRGTIFEALVGPEALLCAEKEGLLGPDVNVDYAGATLIVLRGPGEQSNTNNRKGEITVTSGGKSVTLTQSGIATFVSNSTAKPSEPFFISEPLFNYFNRRLRTMPSGDENYSPFPIDSRVIRPEIEIETDDGLIPFNPVEDLDLPQTDIFDLEQ